MRASLGLLSALALLLPACGGGGGVATPGPAPTSTSNTASAFTCPTSDGTSSTVRLAGAGAEAARRMHVRAPKAAVTTSVSRIAVIYDRGAYQRSATSFARNEQSAGGTLTRSFDFSHINEVVDVLSVPASNANAAMAALRAQSGVLSVAATGQRRYSMTANAYWTGDPYFDGFMETVIEEAGQAPFAISYPPWIYPTTYEGTGMSYDLTYNENQNVPGQWDMHAIQLEHAFGYSQPGGTYTANANALGSASIKLAIIDTGQDTLHPELANRVPYQRCFITPTNSSGQVIGPQSTSDFTTDQWGHGTDVTGIAAASTGNGVGFAGAGGNTGLMGYRVFPTPDDTCATNPTTTDPQCGADTSDIASAIYDAVHNGASVISLSLGGGGCTNGVDNDPTENAAIADAIANQVVVVAAAGNESLPGSRSAVDAPACATGVIAVGATSLDDGFPNGFGGGGNAGGTESAPVEYVASYSNAGSPGIDLRSGSAWGIVAPGGDPVASGNDNDELHWIENIWTSTPYMSSPSDTYFEGSCTEDFPYYNSMTPPVDCRTLIAGTSQATPHVAGVAAIVCALEPSQCTPVNMKNFLCMYADDLKPNGMSDPAQGCGRLNAYVAIAHAINDSAPPTPIP